MKTILIATDFSAAARNASIYGMELARAFNARVVLFTAYQQIPVQSTETALMLDSENIKQITLQLLEQEAKEINSRNITVVETRCNEGFIADSILNAANEMQADLIVSAMKLNDKTFRKIFGSTVTALTKKLNIPMIVVPERADYFAIKTIALASESDLPPDTSNHLLDLFREIAERFHSKVYIVHVFDDRFREAYEYTMHPIKLERMIRTLDPQYEQIEGNDIPASLNRFVKGYHVDLLAIVPHKQGQLKNIFIKSTTHSMVFDTYVPLLILPESDQKN